MESVTYFLSHGKTLETTTRNLFQFCRNDNFRIIEQNKNIMKSHVCLQFIIYYSTDF